MTAATRIEPVTPIAAHLGAVGTAAASASRLLHDRRLGALWQALDLRRGGLSLAAVPEAGNAPRGYANYALELDCDAGRFSLAIACRADAALSLAAAPDLGAPLRALAAEALFGETTERLSRLVLPGVQAVSLAPLAGAQVPRTGWCSLRRDGAEIARIAVQQLPGPVHDALRGAARPHGQRSAWRSLLRLPGAAVIASRALSIDVLRSLRVGDVVLLPAELQGLEGAAAVLRLGPRGARCLAAPGRIQGNSWTVEGGLQMLDDDQDLLAEPGEPADAIGELELPVRFEIETVSVPLSDLEAIEPGYVIELAVPAAEARLRLVSCGQVIGHAELVAVGSRLGARITRMVARDDADHHG
jgi:type III secretion protein Q